MAQAEDTHESFEIKCPHCKKQFTGALISGSAARYHGFKCPHCKLFVPYRPAAEPA
jgi:phage FluMu protein Com